MYSYSFDLKSGGIVLNSSPTIFSKEPRPVWADELDLLGFDRYWNYEKQNDVPFMWAESNVYWYRGIQIAKTKGGDLYNAPELLPVRSDDGSIPFSKIDGYTLQPIDMEAMCRQNEELMTIVEDTTVKKIIKEYEKFKNRLDIFHVAFSGGKDSAVLLDLVKKALPIGSFIVIFGDTGMEFPDTYDVVRKTKEQCEEDGTPFYIAKSHFEPCESWKLFGPPSKTLRWCCSVHKSTPQTIKMREILGKDDYTGLDFVGVRKHESLARSTYEYENYGKKQKGQYSFNPILEWTSAEIWLYIFMNDIIINDSYKKGNSRAGCLLCPMSSGSSDYARRKNYPEKVDQLISMIQESNSWDSHSKTDALPNAIRENGYFVLSDYGRFKNSRAANVEVHGGATLEEVVVPVIRLSLRKQDDVVIKLLNADAIYCERHSGTLIEFYISDVENKNNIALVIAGKRYVAVPFDSTHYSVTLNDIKRAKKNIVAEIYDGDNLIGSVKFDIKGKAATLNTDFDDLF